MDHFEHQFSNNPKFHPCQCWFRYVSDIIVISLETDGYDADMIDNILKQMLLKKTMSNIYPTKL